MSPIEEQTLEELRSLNKNVCRLTDLLANKESDYCFSGEAARIIGIKNKRDLKLLHEAKVLPRNKIGKEYRYLKADCHKTSLVAHEILNK